MRTLVSAELLKLRTTRALGVTVPLLMVLSAGLPALAAAAEGSDGNAELVASDLADLLAAPARLTGGAVLLLGLLLTAGEFRHRTVLTTRLAEPRPLRTLVAKLLTMAVVGLLVGVLVEITVGVGTAVVFAQQGIAFDPGSPGAARTALVVPMVVALHGVAGVAVGALLRSTAGAVGATLVWAFVVEGVIPVVTRQPGLVDWLPTGLVQQVLAGGGGSPGPVVAAGLLLAYAGALAGSAALLDRHREV